jgi:magnesium-transporting ATPase (P-type)
MDAVYALVLQTCVLLIRIVTIFLNEKKKSEESYEKNKNDKYRVFRNGNFIELEETKIVVGDIIELDYKEKVPASGILISKQ